MRESRSAPQKGNSGEARSKRQRGPRLGPRPDDTAPRWGSHFAEQSGSCKPEHSPWNGHWRPFSGLSCANGDENAKP